MRQFPSNPRRALWLARCVGVHGFTYSQEAPRRRDVGDDLEDNLTPDADRFLFTHDSYPPADAALGEIRIIQNWFAELGRQAQGN